MRKAAPGTTAFQNRPFAQIEQLQRLVGREGSRSTANWIAPQWQLPRWV
jgi:hypothetical protein